MFLSNFSAASCKICWLSGVKLAVCEVRVKELRNAGALAAHNAAAFRGKRAEEAVQVGDVLLAGDRTIRAY